MSSEGRIRWKYVRILTTDNKDNEYNILEASQMPGRRKADREVKAAQRRNKKEYLK